MVLQITATGGRAFDIAAIAAQRLQGRVSGRTRPSDRTTARVTEAGKNAPAAPLATEKPFAVLEIERLNGTSGASLRHPDQAKGARISIRALLLRGA
jgi:hypothetical protein